MSMDGGNMSVSVSGGTTGAPANLNDILGALDSGTVVLFAQGVYSLTANLALPTGVTLVIEGDDVTIDGDDHELDLPGGQMVVAGDASSFTLNNIVLTGGLPEAALLRIAAGSTPSTPLAFNAAEVSLRPSAGAAALSFERPVTGQRAIDVAPSAPAVSADLLPDTFSIDLGSGAEATILPKIYQELQGRMSLSSGSLNVTSPESLKKATIAIKDSRPGDTLSVHDDAHTLARLLRVSIDFDPATAVLTIAAAEGRFLNADLVELLIDSVKFENNTITPGLSREFLYTITDRNGDTASATAILLINDINAAPELQLNAIDESGWVPGAFTAVFSQGDTAVDITTKAAIRLTDPEDDAIKFVTFRINDVGDASAESLLLRSIARPGDPFGLAPAEIAELVGVTVEYDSATATLTLSASAGLLADGIATTDLFEFLVNEVKYANTAENPIANGTTSRTIEVIAKDTLTVTPATSAPLIFQISLVGDNLSAINAATDAAEMRAAILDTPEVAALLDGTKFIDLPPARQDALLLDLVENRPSEADGQYTTFVQFSDNFFAPLEDAYDAIRLAVAAPSVASIQTALDALSAALTLSGEPGLDKAALQAQLNTFATLNVLKTPILDAVASVSSDVVSLVMLVDAFGDVAPRVAADAIAAATTVAGVRDILDDVFKFVSGATADAYGALTTEARNVLAVALLQSTETDFAGLQADFEAAFGRLNALTDPRKQAVIEDVNAALASFENETASLDAVIGAREDVQAAVNGLVAAVNDGVPFEPFGDGPVSGQQLRVKVASASAEEIIGVAKGSNFQEVDLGVTFSDGQNIYPVFVSRYKGLNTGDQATLGVLRDGQMVSFVNGDLPEAQGFPETFAGFIDVLSVLLGRAEAELGRQLGTITLDTATETLLVSAAPGMTVSPGLAVPYTPPGFDSDEADRFFYKLIFGPSANNFSQFIELFYNSAGEVTARNNVSPEATGAEVQLTVTFLFQRVLDALEAVVTAELREVLTDNTPVEDISAADLGAAITQFLTLSAATQTATLAAVQAGDGYTTLASVLDAFEPAIRGVLLDALNAAADVDDVLAVLDDAATLYPADFIDFQGVPGESQAFAAAVLLANQPYATFEAAEAAFGQSVALVQAAEAFLTAANAADVAGLSAALGDALTAIGDLTVPGFAADDIGAFKTALDALAPGRDQAAANDLQANGGDGWTLSDLYNGDLFPLGAGLVAFRAAVQDAVAAAETGTFARGDGGGTLEGVLAALQAVEAVRADATINGAEIAGIISGKENLIARVNALTGSPDEPRFEAFVEDLKSSYSSFASLIVRLDAVLTPREAVQAAVNGLVETANGGGGTVVSITANDVEYQLSFDGALPDDGPASASSVTVGGVQYLAAEAEEWFVEIVTREGEVVELDLFFKAGPVLVDVNFFEGTGVLVEGFVVDANGVPTVAEASASLAVADFQAVQTALQAIEDAGLTTEVGGEPVEDISADALAAKLLTFGELRPSTQEAVLAEVQTGSFTTLGGVLDAFPAALDKVGLDLVNGAATATGLLAALADIAVYVTDNAALNAVLALRSEDPARAEALANDFLLNRDGDFTGLAEAGALLAVLEDVYSGLDVAFDADLFTLGTKGDTFFTLNVGGVDVELANIGSIEFTDKTAHVVGNGALQTLTEAVAAVGANDAILLSSGEFAEAVTVDKADVTLIGANAGTAGNGTRGDETQITGTLRFGADRVTVDGIEFVVAANSRGVAPAGFENGLIKNSVFTGGEGDVSRGIQGDFFGFPQSLTIENNLFTTDFGIAGTEGMTNLTVTGNVFQTGTEAVGFGAGVTIADVSGNTVPSVDQLVNYTNAQITLGANMVGGVPKDAVILGTNGNDTIAATSADEAISAQAGVDLVTFSGNLADYTVSISNGVITVTGGTEGTNTLTGVEAIKFADGFAVLPGLSIQTAINLASAGDTINVLAGVYEETIDVNKAVNLVGPNAALLAYDGDRGTFEAVIGGKVTMSANDASLAGFTLTKAEANTQLTDTTFFGWDMNSVLVSGDGVTLANNIIEVFGGQTGKSGFVELSGATTFTGNVVKAGAGYDAANDARGASAIIITAGTDDAVTVSNNHLLVSTNVSVSGDADAIFLNSAGTVVIDGNLMKGTDGGFVAFGNYGTVTITNNTIEDYAKTGLRIFESTNATKPDVIVSGNTVSDGGTGAIVFVQGAVKLGSDGEGFPALADNFTGIPAIYRANDLAGDFGVFANGALSLFATADAAKTAAGANGVIWSFADAQFLVFDGMSIQAAVNAAEAGDTIVVADGMYGPVTLDKGVALVALGDGATILGAGINQGAAVKVADGVEDVSITGFTIAVGAGDLAAVYLVSSNTNIALSDNTITGGAAHAVLTGGKSNGVTLTGNTISGDGPLPVVYALGVASLGAENASSNVSLIDNTITGNPGAGLLVGLESTGGIVQGNSFEGSASYAALELFGGGVTVGGTEEDGEANSFSAFPRVIIDQNGNYTLADLLANNTFATPEIVLIRNAETGNIYNSLAEALGDAQSGQTVKVSAGELDLSSEGRLTVPAGVTLTGAGLDNGTPLTSLKGALLELADDAKVEGLAFTGYEGPPPAGQPIVLVTGVGATFEGNTFTTDGAKTAGAAEIRVEGEGALISGNTIIRDTENQRSAISVANVAKVTITDNTVQGAIIGVVTAASGVDLTITGNTITPTVGSNDGIFVTGPGFGNLPDESTVNIGSNTYLPNGNNVLLGLQLRGTETAPFDFTNFVTDGNDFFQGGTGADTFTLSAGDDLLDGGAGVDTVKTGAALDFSKIGASGSDIILTVSGTDTLRNIERLEVTDGDGTQTVSLVSDTGFSIGLAGTDARPALFFADASLQFAVVAVNADSGVTNALTLGGGDFSYGDLTLSDNFTLNVAGNSTLGNVDTGSATLTLTGANVEVTLGTVSGTLDAGALSFGVSATAAPGSTIIGGLGQDVITIDADFNAATFAVVTDTDGSSVTVTVGDDVYTVSSVEKLQFNNGKTVYIAGAGSGLSVQGAVDAATSGDSVFVAGAFDEVVTVPAGKALDIFGTGLDSSVNAFDIKGNGTSVTGMAITGGGNTSGSTAGIYVAASDVDLTNLTLTGPGQGVSGGQARGILTEGGEGAGLTVTNVTATDWATGIYLNPGAADATVTGSNLSGNYVGMSIDGEDGVQLTGNIFGGAVEDLGLGAAGIASATGNNFLTGQFGNFTGQVVTLGGNVVSGTGFDSIKLGRTTAADTITLVSESGATLVIGGGGVNTVVAPNGAAFGLTLDGITVVGSDIVFGFVDGQASTVTATLRGVQRFGGSVGEESGFASVEDGILTVSFVADGAFPVKLEGSGSRPDIFFDAADLPGVMALSAQQLGGEAVVITLIDAAATYPGVIDLTGLELGFNAASITVQRDGDADVFIGPVFAPQDTVVLGDGVRFANVAPELANGDVFVADPVEESLTGAPNAAFTVAQLNSLFRDDDVGSTLEGIALVGIESPGDGIVAGRWQFKTVGDGAFRDIIAVLASENLSLSPASAMLLANTTELRFVPDAAAGGDDRNFGRVPELSFVSVDSTQPLIDGGRFTTSARLRLTDVSEGKRGGSTPYSEAVASFTQEVTALVPPEEPIDLEIALSRLTEDAFTNPDGSFEDGGGDTIGSIFGSSFGGVETAIVVVANAAVPSQGSWQYRLPEGDWVDIGAVTSGAALFLGADAELRFLPNWNFSGEAPELSVRAVTNPTGLSTQVPVDASSVGFGSNFSASVATLGVEVSAAADTYTFGRAEGSATFEFEGNPGSVFNYNGAPVVSLLNFDRTPGDDRDLIEFDLSGMPLTRNGQDTPLVFVNVLNNQTSSTVNFVVANVNFDGIDENSVADAFTTALSAAGRVPGIQIVNNAVVGRSFGSGFGLFREQVSGETSLWYAPELNPLVSGIKGEVFEATLLGYFAGESWSLAYQDLGEVEALPPSTTVADLQKLVESDFSLV